MRFGAFATSIAAMVMAVAPVAVQAAQVAGTVAAGKGEVFVSRDGGLLRATPNMALYAGDRVVTRAGSTAKIALNSGCSQTVGASAMATVGTAGCGPVQNFDAGRAGYAGRSSAATGTTLVLVVAAVAAAGLGIYEGVKKKHNDRTSP